jgi:hypothetical protein
VLPLPLASWQQLEHPSTRNETIILTPQAARCCSNQRALINCMQVRPLVDEIVSGVCFAAVCIIIIIIFIIIIMISYYVICFLCFYILERCALL